MNITRPPMGVTLRFSFGENTTDALVRETADSMVSRGLRDAGYEYIVLADGWCEKERGRGSDRLEASHEKFPEGIKSLADYVHSKGLKLGIYASAGYRTYKGYPGSAEHEFADADTFASWGIDMVEYEYPQQKTGTEEELLFRRMGTALSLTGRDILYSICSSQHFDPNRWARSAGAHMFRQKFDGELGKFPTIFPDTFNKERGRWAFTGKGCYKGIGPMTIGCPGAVGHGEKGEMTTDDAAQEFSLYCFHSCPLFIACDVRTVSDEICDVLKNSTLIRIDQDSECRPPIMFDNGDIHVNERLSFAKHLDDGTYALGIYNLKKENKTLSPSFLLTDIGLARNSGYEMICRDIMTGEQFPCDTYLTFSLPAGKCRLFIASMSEKGV